MTPQPVIGLGRPTLVGGMTGRCNDCGGAGYTFNAAAGTATECTCREAQRVVGRITAANIPAALFPAAARKLEAPPAPVSVVDRRAWTEARARLCGAVADAAALGGAGQVPDVPRITAAVRGVAGSGKSWLLATALREALLRHGLPCLYLSVGDAMHVLRRLGDNDLDAGIHKADAIAVLALDDVGGHGVDVSARIVRDLILRRHAALLATVIATRLAADDLANELGSSAADIIRGGTVVLTHGSLR